MPRLYLEKDAPSDGLSGQQVVIAGFGNQGRAQAENLRDSGFEPVIALREGGESWAKAAEAGFEVLPVAEAAARADILMMLTPDETQAELFETEIAPNLKSSSALGFSHGFAVGFGLLDPGPEIDVFLVAPKAQGLKVRELYQAGKGAAVLIGVEKDASGKAWDRALAYAAAIGCLRTGALETTLREEAISDLFGEQAVLCGGLSELIRAAFDTLTARGYDPEIAYFETLHEVKILADLIHAKGIDGMRRHISGTALWGDLSRGRRVIDASTRERMEALLDDIESGRFAREWVQEHRSGRGKLRERLEADAQHPIESAGRKVRGLMPWLEEEE